MIRAGLLVVGMVGLFLGVFLLTRDHPWLGPAAVARSLEEHRTAMLPLGWALMAADLILPVPATVVVGMFGWQWGVLGGAVAGTAGSVLAGVTAYGLCRALGRRAAVFLAGQEGLRRMEGFFQRWGIIAVAVSRSLPIVPETLGCLAGLCRMSFGSFLAGCIIGAAPMAVCYAGIGAWGRAAETPGWSLFLSVCLPVILVVPVSWAVRKHGARAAC